MANISMHTPFFNLAGLQRRFWDPLRGSQNRRCRPARSKKAPGAALQAPKVESRLRHPDQRPAQSRPLRRSQDLSLFFSVAKRSQRRSAGLLWWAGCRVAQSSVSRALRFGFGLPERRCQLTRARQPSGSSLGSGSPWPGSLSFECFFLSSTSDMRGFPAARGRPDPQNLGFSVSIWAPPLVPPPCYGRYVVIFQRREAVAETVCGAAFVGSLQCAESSVSRNGYAGGSALGLL